MTSSRSWEMVGMRSEDTWVALGSDFYVRAHGCPDPIPVLVTEDPDGDYMGWLDADDRTIPREGLVMIQRKEIFDVQFPYGHRAEVERGRGEAVRVRIEPT